MTTLKSDMNLKLQIIIQMNYFQAFRYLVLSILIIHFY